MSTAVAGALFAIIFAIGLVLAGAYVGIRLCSPRLILVGGFGGGLVPAVAITAKVFWNETAGPASFTGVLIGIMLIPVLVAAVHFAPDRRKGLDWSFRAVGGALVAATTFVCVAWLSSGGFA